jgi:hypothetical protein
MNCQPAATNAKGLDFPAGWHQVMRQGREALLAVYDGSRRSP